MLLLLLFWPKSTNLSWNLLGIQTKLQFEHLNCTKLTQLRILDSHSFKQTLFYNKAFIYFWFICIHAYMKTLDHMNSKLLHWISLISQKWPYHFKHTFHNFFWIELHHIRFKAQSWQIITLYLKSIYFFFEKWALLPIKYKLNEFKNEQTVSKKEEKSTGEISNAASDKNTHSFYSYMDNTLLYQYVCISTHCIRCWLLVQKNMMRFYAARIKGT